ncbi:rhomboid family intramembrane serine protease [Halopseudomonas salegens]|uniref:Membrane associated serine protease, rhomboid family n=1 Tax=Halopseudomonas salegens TaxID=1434072 RepID=A0A1H2G7K1_9GAMM|nr:rhomboid family intramembrane serine protease [Halopseudomonas salegens]SDU15544.1 Membrane associated serine protease, rhomboid family [Halopseudomonas salegens]
MAGKKHCPHCVNTTLAVNYYEGEEVDNCNTCGGLWFERGSLNAIIAAKCQHVEEADYVANLGPALEPSHRHCPDCGTRLQVFHVLNDFHVDIDVCQRCDGAWVEKDTACKVAKSSAIKHALVEMNKTVNWKTWIFQMLSRMPLEYNVKPRITPWVTYALIAINTLIFLTYGFDPVLAGRVFGGFAIAPADIQAGSHWWAFVTAIFLHGSLMHLIGNMYFLWVIGDNLEDALGHWRFLGLYLLCGILAGLVSVLANLGSEIPSVGASGAIAGLFGMYILWFPNASMTFMFFVWQKKLAVMWYFAIWLALNFYGMAMGQQGIDYWAHVGGFIAGLAIGFALRQRVWTANPLLAHLAGPEVKVRR